MDGQDKHRFVLQYVQRQKAYLPSYTAEGLVGAPSKSPRGAAEFGFGTPVLRPRALQHEAGGSNQRRRGEAPLARDAAPRKEDKPRTKRKTVSTRSDTGSERAARLADRRERKRKKRAIVSPPQQGDEVTAPRKGRTKKPTALALLYGFSATNVTKDRLTMKPALSPGVFSKGKASAKKKVIAANKHSSRHELFSESAFLNKPSERAADPSKSDNDADGSLTGDQLVPREVCSTERTRRDRGKYTAISPLKTTQVTTGTTAESEVWDIEMQSKLPSSARDVSSEPEGKESASVVVDLRGADWCAAVDGENQSSPHKTRAASMPVSQSGSRGHLMAYDYRRAGSELEDEFHPCYAANVSTVHPSHSASQVGRRTAETETTGVQLATTKYFAEPEPAADQPANPPERSRSDNSLGIADIQEQDVVGATLDMRMTHRGCSPMSTLMSVPLRMAEFRTRYDMDPHELRRASCLSDDSLGWVGVDPPESPDRGRWGWTPLDGITADDVELQGGSDRVGGEREDDLECFLEGQSEYGGEYEEDSVQGSDCNSDGVGDYLEGRALLLGVEERAGCAGLSGLAEAEMDVASRLRDHWRPMRF